MSEMTVAGCADGINSYTFKTRKFIMKDKSDILADYGSNVHPEFTLHSIYVHRLSVLYYARKLYIQTV